MQSALKLGAALRQTERVQLLVDIAFDAELLPRSHDACVAGCTEIAKLEAANPKSDSAELGQARARVGKLAAHPKGGDLPGLIAGWAARRG